MVTPPPRTGEAPVASTAVAKRRRFRRAKTDVPEGRQGAEAGQADEAAEAEASRPQGRGAAAAGAVAARSARRASRPAPKRPRTWKLRHWVVILAAPLLLVAGGVVAYAKLTERGPMVAVPDVTDRDVFAAIAIMHDAGLRGGGHAPRTARAPAAPILDQRPDHRRTSSKRARP